MDNVEKCGSVAMLQRVDLYGSIPSVSIASECLFTSNEYD